MKKCFPADETTIGGRVRKARLDAGYTIKGFAALMDVSPNHLGLVERGEKQASFKLLQKIAEATETPYQWIIKGAQQGAQQKKSIDAVPVEPAEEINLRLFLGLILIMAPAISKEILASLLNTSTDVIDRILNGEDVERDPQWPARFPVLAGLMGEIATIRKDLQELDKFLSDVEFDRGMNILKENLIKYLYMKDKRQYKLYQPISRKLQRYEYRRNYETREFEVDWTTLAFYNVDNPKLLWHFRLLQTQYTLDENDMKVIFDSVADTADDLLTNVTVLFVSQDNYDAFADAANRAISKIAMIEAGYDAMDTPVSYEFSASYSNLSYALVDRETWTVNDWSDINS